MELVFSRQTLEKSSNAKFHKNLSVLRAELFHVDRHTDGDDEANSRFSQICERA